MYREEELYRIFEFWVWLPTRADQPSLAASSSPEPGWPAASSCRKETGGLTSAQHWLSMFEVILTRTADWYRGLNIAPEMWLAQQNWEFKSVTSDTVKFGWGEIWRGKNTWIKSIFKDRHYTLFTPLSAPAFCLAPPPASQWAIAGWGFPPLYKYWLLKQSWVTSVLSWVIRVSREEKQVLQNG